MHFVVLGATGAIGGKFCELALNANHQLTLLVRNPSKLPDEIHQNEAVKVVQGTLDNDAALDEVSECGADAFVSFAGPPFGNKGTPLTNGYKSLVPKLVAHNIKRILILCTPSYRHGSESAPFKFRFGGWFMRIFSPGQYWEMVGVGRFVASLDNTDIKWTLFRVGGLTDVAEGPVEASYLGSSEKQGMWISRASVARWVLDEAIQDKWVGAAPYICNI